MNIILTEEEHLFLQTQIIQTIIFGSRLYGTHNERSDTDKLCIYKTSDIELHSGLPNIHQFQFKDKDKNIDYIYCSELQFWKNLLSGDSTINADIVLFTDLYPRKLEICRTYKTIKAYLGFAKRDLQKKEFKKLLHAARSLYCAEKLINHEIPSIFEIQKIFNDYLDYETLIKKENDLRKNLNDLYNNNLINNFYIEECENILWRRLLESNNIREFRY